MRPTRPRTGQSRACQVASSATGPFDEGSGSVATDGSGNGYNGSLQYGPTWTTSAALPHRGLPLVRRDGRLRQGRRHRRAPDHGRPDHLRVDPADGCTHDDGDRQQALRVRARPGAQRRSVPVALVSQGARGDARARRPDGVDRGRTSGSTSCSCVTAPPGRCAATRTACSPSAPATWPRRAPAPTTLNIGRNPGGNTRFRGSMDEVRIYDRVLSESEIQALYSR